MYSNVLITNEHPSDTTFREFQRRALFISFDNRIDLAVEVGSKSTCDPSSNLLNSILMLRSVRRTLDTEEG